MSNIDKLKTKLSKHKTAYSKLLNAEKPNLEKVSKAIEKQFRLMKEFADEIEKMPMGDKRKEAVKALKKNKVKFFREDREAASRVGESVSEVAKEVEKRRRDELRKMPSMIVDSTGETVTFDEPEEDERTEPKRKRDIVEKGKERRQETTTAVAKQKRAAAKAERRKKQLALEDKDVEMKDEDTDEEMEDKPLMLENATTEQLQKALEDRKAQADPRYKAGVDVEEAKKRREETTVAITKKKKAQKMLEARREKAAMKNQRVQALEDERKSEESKQQESLEKVPVPVNRITDLLDGDAEERAPNAAEAIKEFEHKNGEGMHVDEINEPPADDEQKGEERAPPAPEPMEVEAPAPPAAAPVAAPPAPAPIAAPVAAPAQPPPAAPAAEPTVAQPMPREGEMVEEKFAYPGDMGIRPGAAFAPTTMDQDDAKHRMRKSIKFLKLEIQCFRELYKDKVAKIKQLSRVSMANKTIDEIRSLHKQHSDAIKNYYTAHRGLRVGVIVDPSVLGINLQGLQNMIAPRVPIVQPPVQQARDTLRPRDPYAKGGVPPATRVGEVHYQLGGLKSVGLGGGYDRDIEAMNKGQDKQEDRRLHNRGTTRFGKAPVFKNYGFQNKKTYIASGIKLKGSKKY